MNKTIWLRIIALVIVLASLFTLFAACENNENDDKSNKTDVNDTNLDESNSEEQETAEATPDSVGIDKKNYDDEFYLSILPDTNPEKYFWVETTEGDAMSEAVFARQEKIFNWLGVTIKEKSAGNHSTYIAPFKTAVTNKDGSVDTLITHVSQGVAGLVQEMYLQDFQDIPGIDLDQDYWNHEFMDALSIADNYYMGFSDFNILYTYVIAFNKKMLSQLALEGFSEDDLYKMVLEGEWTLDTFLDLAQKGFQSKGGEGKDIYGLVGQQWVPWIGFLHASNISYVEQDETGTYKIALMNDANKEKTAGLVDKLKNFSASGYGQFTFPSGGTISAPEAKFTDNRALMYLSSTYSLVGYLDYDVAFGVLPYPMYDTEQYDEDSDSLGYRSLQWGGYLTIPAYLRNTEMTGETLELLAFYSKPVQTTFYEKLLGKQVAEAPNDAKMLEIVWDSVCSDFGQTYSDESGGTLYTIPYVTWPGSGGKELVSYVSSLETSGNKKLAAFIKKVDKLSKAQK